VRIALLHGFAGDPAAWADVIDAWPRAGDVLRAIALPGHGRPCEPDWAANLVALEPEVTGADVVVGYSLGARLALGLLATGRIERAVLIGAGYGIDAAERAARRAHDATWASVLRADGIAAFVAAWEAQPLFASQARVDPLRLAARRARRLALDPEGLARSLETMGLAEMPDYRGADLASVRAVAGADDARYLALARSVGLAPIAIRDAGHDVPLEQPRALAHALAQLM
jgi:2-succinyl-6-hydroxy-2,4-cyclohexadiene-1-carboxylate synthase